MERILGSRSTRRLRAAAGHVRMGAVRQGCKSSTGFACLLAQPGELAACRVAVWHRISMPMNHSPCSVFPTRDRRDPPADGRYGVLDPGQVSRQLTRRSWLAALLEVDAESQVRIGGISSTGFSTTQ
jgi:hypothetical protein